MIEGSLNVCEGKSEGKYDYLVDIKESKINGKIYHETFSKYNQYESVEQNLNFSLFQSLADRKRSDAQVDTYENQYLYKENGITFSFQRVVIKKILFMKKKEILILHAYKKIDNDHWVDAFCSYEEPSYPICDQFERILILKAGIYFKRCNNDNNNDQLEEVSKNEDQVYFFV